MSRDVLNVLLAHQPNSELIELLQVWKPAIDCGNLLIAHGGSRLDFEAVTHEPKIYIEDPRLRTRNHPRELQSLTGVFKAVAAWLHERANFQFVHLVEYDHLPLVDDLNDRQIQRLHKEAADVLAYHVARLDGTNHPHYLHHIAKAGFRQFFAKLSRRENTDVVLSMLGTGSFWTREAFDAVAQIDEPLPMYFELYLPTLAHHLGFRVRGFAEQNAFVASIGDRAAELQSARTAGAWTLHPVKQLRSRRSPG